MSAFGTCSVFPFEIIIIIIRDIVLAVSSLYFQLQGILLGGLLSAFRLNSSETQLSHALARCDN